MPSKLTLEQFLSRSRERHGNAYDYSLVVYVNQETRVTIKCPVHGDFQQAPKCHLGGSGCSACVPKANAERFKLGEEEFKRRATKVHAGKYGYDKVAYTNLTCRVIVSCPKHGDFEITAARHLKGYGCRACLGLSPKKDRQQFLDEAKRVHGDKYDYSKVVYKRAKDKVEIVCKVHGSFWQRSSHHLNGFGCQKCGLIASGLKRRGPNNHFWNPDREYVKARAKMCGRCVDLLRKTLKRLNLSKNLPARKMLGYSTRQLMDHLTNHPNWELVKDGKWHIDHIFPISAFVKHGILDPRIINCLDNLRPLGEFENLSKKDVYDEEAFFAWLWARFPEVATKLALPTRTQRLG